MSKVLCYGQIASSIYLIIAFTLAANGSTQSWLDSAKPALANPVVSEYDFQTFQERHRDPCRSLKNIKEKIGAQRKRIFKLLEEHKTRFRGRDSIKFYLTIYRNGHVLGTCKMDTCIDDIDDSIPRSSLFFENYKIQREYLLKADTNLPCRITVATTDTVVNHVFENFFKNISFDSLPEDNSLATATFEIVRSKGKSRLKFSDSVIFIPGPANAGIDMAIKHEMPQIKHCYDKHLRTEPELHGQLKVKFAIDEFGGVVFCGIVENSTGSGEFADAIREIIRKWSFRCLFNRGDITEVIYPFVFSR